MELPITFKLEDMQVVQERSEFKYWQQPLPDARILRHVITMNVQIKTMALAPTLLTGI